MEKYLTVSAMMKALGVGRSTAYNLVKLPDFPTIKIGKRILVSESALQAWLDKGGTESKGA